MLGENIVIDNTIRMSLSAFRLETKPYWSTIQESEATLIDIYNTLIHNVDIHSHHYKRLIFVVGAIEEVVQKLCKLLQDSAQLPLSILPHRYFLLATLQNMDEQMQTLLSLTAHFKTASKNPSKRILALHQEIRRKLKLLMQDCNGTVEQIFAILDKARFEEKKMKQYGQIC